MPACKIAVSTETISVLDDQYRYDSSAEIENARWLDLNNVMSVKRDKTIYAIRARNTYNFTGNDNTQFFANTISEYRLPTNSDGDYAAGTFFTSNIYRGFGSEREDGVANNIFEVLVYGNVASANLGNIGVGGSLDNGFTYGQFGDVNVQSNVAIYGNLEDSNVSGLLPDAFAATITGNVLSIAIPNGTTANVNGNATCFQKVQYNDSTINRWNRLINAEIGGSAYVNASTDPCDFQGAAVNNMLSTESGGAYTNEAFRHQFQLRKNTNSTSQNPIYVARISRFGQRLADNQNNAIANNLAIQHFSSNFFASIPSDNSLYAGGNLISSINITGNIKSTQLYVFNSNFLTGQLYPEGAVGGNFNGDVTSTLSGLANNSRFLTMELDPSAAVVDTIKINTTLIDNNNSVNSTGSFQEGDRFGFVQANVSLDQGYMLIDRIAFRTPDVNFVNASTVFSQPADMQSTLVGNLIQNYDRLWFSSNMLVSATTRETSSKYLVIKGINIQADNWVTTSLMTPSSLAMPYINGNPNLQYYTIGNTINTYLRRGDMSMKNYTYVNNKTLTGVNYISTVPGFINDVILPSGNITLSSNVLENGADMLDTATTQINLPLLGNALSPIRANISCNYTILFSGNVNVEDRVNKTANVVCPSNFANSFIANCWNYDEFGVPVNGSGSAQVFSNVSIIYGENKPIPNGEVVNALRLDSDFANENITYDLEFVRVTGQSNADTELTRDNYVFYANLDSNGSAPSDQDTSISMSSSLSQLNNNQHINSMNVQDRAYSEYDFGSLSYKFTDGNGVLGTLQRGTNYNYNYILPTALVQSSTTLPSDDVLINDSDSHLNVIVDYLVFNSLPTDGYNWHQLTFYNVAYRYGIESVSVVNGSTFNNNLLLNNESFNPSNLYADATVSPPVNGRIEASAISCYVYENLSVYDNLSIDNGNAQSELLYPFTIPISPTGAIPASNQNALFPGFRYTAGAAANTFSIYSAKTATECDLILPANSSSAQTVQIIIQSQDLTNGTFKVGLSNGIAKPIAIKPVPHGRSISGDLKYATPIVCAIAGEPNSYVIVMVECASDLANGGLSLDISFNTPVYINISIIETSNDKQQLTMNASLRVFNDDNEMSQTIANDFFIKTSISQLNYVNSSLGSFNQTAQLGVNIYSVPANGSILSFIYHQDVIKRVLSYTREDYALVSNSVDQYRQVNNNVSSHFAYSVENLSEVPVADGIFPAINANSTRFYLDTRSSGIFIDVSNDTNLTAETMSNLVVGRSVEWVLKRSYNNITETVGRGLMSKSSANFIASVQTYYIYENLTPQNASGYLHCITTNIVNLASRCIMQSLQTNAFITNGSDNNNNWVITTLSDELNAMIVRINGATGQLFSTTTNNNIIKQASVRLDTPNQLIDLGSLFGGSEYAETFVSLVMGPIRGFGYNPFAANGTLNMSTSMFGLTIQPDNYCLVHLTPGPRGGSQGSNLSESDVLFSEEHVVKTKYANDFSLSFENASLAYQYLNSSSALSTTAFTVIGNYVYNGFGTVEIYTKDFRSNYTNVLESYQIAATTTLNPLGDPSSDAWQVDNIDNNEQPTQTVQIRLDLATSKYYFNLDENINLSNPLDRVYFRGVNNLPTEFNNKSSLLLYTGLRPLVINVLEVGSNGVRTLEGCITSAAIFNWNNADINNPNTTNIFTSLDANSVTTGLGAALSNQFYQVVLTNANAAVASESFNFRGVFYTLSNLWFQEFSIFNPNRNFFGSYDVIAEIFNDLRLNISRTGAGAVSTTYDLDIDFIGQAVNTQSNESQILAGQYDEITLENNLYQSFNIMGKSNNPQTLGYLFRISLLGPIGEFASGDGQGFRLDILPAQMSIYTALDVNNNGEIDNKISTNVSHNAASLSNLFGLENMFSEMNIVLPAVAPNSYRLPTILSSWELTRDYNSVPISGCPFDIRINNRWSVGYNLDCYFTIVTATSAQFDVITVSTKAATTASNEQLTNLEVQTTAPLMIKQQNDWARSLVSDNRYRITAEAQANNFGSLSGLAFKITNNTQNVIAGSIVRLFVDNTMANNTNEWTVNTTTSTNKTYQLFAYDQERYAALLDEQLSITNNFA